MSTQNIYTAVMQLAKAHARRQPLRQHLDVGAGDGQLIELFRRRFQTESSACDYTGQLMKLPGQKVDIVDLNREKLPYPDGVFDVVTATEVVEHLENYRNVLREFSRVLKPGGLCVLTTPNILSLNSRLRFLWFGYANLFGPLPVKNSSLYSTGGHINPVSCFYVAHSLLDAGFTGVTLRVDKFQRSAVPKLLFWFLPIKFFGALARRREISKFKTVDSVNAPFVKAMNSFPLLLGRTIVVAATKL
ncbi:MAG TPA: class I SAM-dependent methyltransferase [Verrucomicrobiae bacterium]|jgi:SAM-dependent methyltransferase